ncbi:MAG TPA: hypothetical protein VF549_04860 [Solirubrobacteraceae bacterium]
MLLLIHDPQPEEPDSAPAPRRGRPLPKVPWRPFAWFAAFCWLLFIAGRVDGLAGYVIVLCAIAMGSWRLDRWLSRQYWGGLSEVQR